jgi:hypothetical protein
MIPVVLILAGLVVLTACDSADADRPPDQGF